MGFLDRAKQLLGLGASREGDDEDHEEHSAPERSAKEAPARGREGRGRDRKDRPPLQDPPPGQSQSVDDALRARKDGDKAEARRILTEIDRGQGLRTVLRAAAALEAGDEAEVRSLLEAVAREAEGWKLPLQVAAALADPVSAARYVDRAVAEKAPAWAIAWTRAVLADEKERREGLVELLFSDAPLARTVAARDLLAAAVLPDPEATQRYTAFAHGRDSIQQFDAKIVAKLIDRALGLGAA
jgi:hypothetical protein